MKTSVPLIAAFVSTPVFMAAAYLTCLEPTALRQTTSSASGLMVCGYALPQIASGPNGHTIVVWTELTGGPPLCTSEVYARMFEPGRDWGPTTLVSDHSGYVGRSLAVAIGPDGAAIVAWRQGVPEPEVQRQLLARKFVPGVGWAPSQVLSTANTEGTYLAMARDGRAHIIFYETDQGHVARTLGPGENVWSEKFVLGHSYETQLVAGKDVAYAAVATHNGVVEVATYTSTYNSWQRVTAVSTNVEMPTGLQLAENNGHAILSWVEFDSNSSSATQWIQRLTGPPDRFTVPRSADALYPWVACPVALMPDATVLVACLVQGAAVPGCFDEGHRGVSDQAFYRYIETYRHPPVGGWLSAEIISDIQKRADPVTYRLLESTQNNALALWTADVPCGSEHLLFARAFSAATSSWEPEMTLGTRYSSLNDVAVDGSGIFHLLWTDRITDVNRTSSQTFSTLFTAEFRPEFPRGRRRLPHR